MMCRCLCHVSAASWAACACHSAPSTNCRWVTWTSTSQLPLLFFRQLSGWCCMAVAAIPADILLQTRSCLVKSYMLVVKPSPRTLLTLYAVPMCRCLKARSSWRPHQWCWATCRCLPHRTFNAAGLYGYETFRSTYVHIHGLKGIERCAGQALYAFTRYDVQGCMHGGCARLGLD